MLVSYRDPFIGNQVSMMRGLDLGVPSLSHLLELAQSSMSQLLFHGSPRASFLGYL